MGLFKEKRLNLLQNYYLGVQKRNCGETPKKGGLYKWFIVANKLFQALGIFVQHLKNYKSMFLVLKPLQDKVQDTTNKRIYI